MHLNGHQPAMWAGLSAFFASLLSITAIDILKPDALIRFASSLAVAGITAGTVYARERLYEAKKEASEVEVAKRIQEHKEK